MVSDPFFTNLVQGSNSNEHDALEGHGKEDIIGTISDPPFTNLVQRSDRNEHDVLEGHGKEDITRRSRILSSPILFKEVTVTRNPCLLKQNLPLS